VRCSIIQVASATDLIDFMKDPLQQMAVTSIIC
jgi:hypothetical protein